MKVREQIGVRWAWRRRRFALPERLRRKREPSPYGYALPRDGVPPGLVVLIAVLAIALGGWLGSLNGAGAPAPDPLAIHAAPSAPDSSVRDAIEALSTARADGRRDLATATTPSHQAAAAVGLRRSYERAAVEIRGAEPAVERALRRTAGAYGALARAAEAGDSRRYARAGTAVGASERALERLIGAIL